MGNRREPEPEDSTQDGPPCSFDLGASALLMPTCSVPLEPPPQAVLLD